MPAKTGPDREAYGMTPGDGTTPANAGHLAALFLAGSPRASTCSRHRLRAAVPRLDSPERRARASALSFTSIGTRTNHESYRSNPRIWLSNNAPHPVGCPSARSWRARGVGPGQCRCSQPRRLQSQGWNGVWRQADPRLGRRRRCPQRWRQRAQLQTRRQSLVRRKHRKRWRVCRIPGGR